MLPIDAAIAVPARPIRGGPQEHLPPCPADWPTGIGTSASTMQEQSSPLLKVNEASRTGSRLARWFEAIEVAPLEMDATNGHRYAPPVVGDRRNSCSALSLYVAGYSARMASPALPPGPARLACPDVARSSGCLNPRADLRQQGGRSLPLRVSLAACSQVPQGDHALAVASFSDAQDSLDEPTASLAIRAAATLPPEDGMPQRPLGGVVRRLDLRARRTPTASARGRSTHGTSAVCGQPQAAPCQCLTDLSPKPTDVDLEAGAVRVPVSNSVPPGDQPVGQVEHFLPRSCSWRIGIEGGAHSRVSGVGKPVAGAQGRTIGRFPTRSAAGGRRRPASGASEGSGLRYVHRGGLGGRATRTARPTGCRS